MQPDWLTYRRKAAFSSPNCTLPFNAVLGLHYFTRFPINAAAPGRSEGRTELSVHFFTPPDFINKFPLEHIHVRVQLPREKRFLDTTLMSGTPRYGSGGATRGQAGSSGPLPWPGRFSCLRRYSHRGTAPSPARPAR